MNYSARFKRLRLSLPSWLKYVLLAVLVIVLVGGTIFAYDYSRLKTEKDRLENQKTELQKTVSDLEKEAQ